MSADAVNDISFYHRVLAASHIQIFDSAETTRLIARINQLVKEDEFTGKQLVNILFDFSNFQSRMPEVEHKI